MIKFYSDNVLQPLRLTLLLIGIPVIISSFELLYNHKLYGPGGWLNWKYHKHFRSVYTLNPTIEKIFERMFKYPSVLLLICMRLLLALWMITDIIHKKDPTVEVLLLCCSGLLLHFRNLYSNNGSDQLSNIVLISASISLLANKNNAVTNLSIFFIACQSVLSYGTSGFLKMIMADWRNGVFLKGIISTTTFGHPLIKKLCDSWTHSYQVISTLLISIELLLGLCFFLPPQLCIVLLLSGVFLHGFIAFMMGLNTFFWTFIATYPCIYFICIKVHK